MTKDLTKYLPKNAADESDFNRAKSLTKASEYLPVQANDEAKELDDDFQEIRRRLTSANILAEEAVKEAIALARSSDHPSAWQVVGELLKSLTKVNEALVKSHNTKIKSKNEITSPSPDSSAQPKTQTNIQQNFFASPAELAEILRKKNDTIDG